MASEFLTLNKLKELLKNEGIRPNKILGQHFLIDKNTRDKIIGFAELTSADTVVEIGPGFGELTESISEKAGKVYGFEKDQHIATVLKKRVAEKENIEIIVNDFLDVETSFFKNIGEKFKIIGNLPYYAVSPILFKLLKLRDYWKSALVSLPQEVSKRIIAVPGEKDFGLMAVLFSLYTETKICYKIGKKVFYPTPDVNSVFLCIKPLKKPSVHIPDEETFWRIIPSIFLYRRKTIENVLALILKIKKQNIKILLETAEIKPSLRSHQLSLEQLIKLVETKIPT